MLKLASALPLVVFLCLQLPGCALPRGTPQQKDVLSSESDQRLADSALDGGNPEIAISLYKKILLRTPEDLHAITGLGNALFQVNNLEQSRQVFLQAEHLSPHQLDAELGLARISIRQRQFAAAIARYQAILQRTPACLPAFAGLGVAFDLQGSHAEAQKTYRQALLAHPDELGLRNNLGLSLILSRDYRNGISELMKIVDNPAAPPQVRQNLALAYGLLGNKSAAGRVLAGELPSPQIQGNLRYYETVRSRLAPMATGVEP
jgi:Flp pilus assembly protein TadD